MHYQPPHLQAAAHCSQLGCIRLEPRGQACQVRLPRPQPRLSHRRRGCLLLGAPQRGLLASDTRLGLAHVALSLIQVASTRCQLGCQLGPQRLELALARRQRAALLLNAAQQALLLCLCISPP